MLDDYNKLRSNLLENFHYFEKLRLVKFNVEEENRYLTTLGRDVVCNNSSSFARKLTDDPLVKNKLNSFRKLYAYLEREIPNLRLYIETQLRKKQQYVYTYLNFIII